MKYGDCIFFKNKKNLIKIFFYWYEYKIGRLFLKLGEAEIEKQELYYSKRSVAKGEVNIGKTLLSDEFPCSKNGSKYFFRL